MSYKLKKICLYCGMEFVGSPQSRFCSKKCWRKAYTMTDKICAICGKPIPDGCNRTKYCSDECKEITSKNYAKAAAQEKPKVRPSGSLTDDLRKAREMGMSYGKYKLWKEKGIRV